MNTTDSLEPITSNIQQMLDWIRQTPHECTDWWAEVESNYSSKASEQMYIWLLFIIAIQFLATENSLLRLSSYKYMWYCWIFYALVVCWILGDSANTIVFKGMTLPTEFLARDANIKACDYDGLFHDQR